ncbi:MAG TPA: amidohydrolase family protein, partial [Lysobacter sp.]
MSRALKGALCALSLCLAAGTALAAQADDAVVSAARMLDVRTGRMLQNVSVVVRDGRIEKVVQGGDAGSVGEGLPHYDLGDMTLLPGLIDMHVHLDSDPTYGGYTGLQFNDRFWSVLAVAHAQRTLQAGFTTVRNVGSDAWNDIGLNQAIEAGKLTGPRIVGAGYAIGATGGHCDSTFFPPSMNQKGPYNVDSPEQGRKSVRTMHKYGAQVIKICATGGVFSHGDEPGAQQLTLAEMTAIAE